MKKQNKIKTEKETKMGIESSKKSTKSKHQNDQKQSKKHKNKSHKIKPTLSPLKAERKHPNQ